MQYNGTGPRRITSKHFLFSPQANSAKITTGKITNFTLVLKNNIVTVSIISGGESCQQAKNASFSKKKLLTGVREMPH